MQGAILRVCPWMGGILFLSGTKNKVCPTASQYPIFENLNTFARRFFLRGTYPHTPATGPYASSSILFILSSNSVQTGVLPYEPFRHILCLQMLKNKTISALLDAYLVIASL